MTNEIERIERYIKIFKELTNNEQKDRAATLTLESDLYSRYIGKYVICRTRNEGINAGTVIKADETGVILQDAQRLYYHKPSAMAMAMAMAMALALFNFQSNRGPLGLVVRTLPFHGKDDGFESHRGFHSLNAKKNEE